MLRLHPLQHAPGHGGVVDDLTQYLWLHLVSIKSVTASITLHAPESAGLIQRGKKGFQVNHSRLPEEKSGGNLRSNRFPQ
jgi:hypothetical protein